ncbi:MAG: hypothetical protein EAZ92_00560 [Candidatus Kapaibacterium sp.]|nr:MAG: hypothetical protein EAZ92_00560 [Candidatus Kapabacteria bacterium]
MFFSSENVLLLICGTKARQLFGSMLFGGKLATHANHKYAARRLTLYKPPNSQLGREGEIRVQPQNSTTFLDMQEVVQNAEAPKSPAAKVRLLHFTRRSCKRERPQASSMLGFCTNERKCVFAHQQMPLRLSALFSAQHKIS